MYNRPELPKAKPGSSSIWFDENSPGYNGYYKWHMSTYGSAPSLNVGGLNAPAHWEAPDDWAFSQNTGYWYTPAEMNNAGYNLTDGQWLHPNDIRQREVDKQNAELDIKIAARRVSEERFRNIRAAGREKMILTGSKGAAGVAMVKKEILHNSKGAI